jgi:hypothetical protein
MIKISNKSAQGATLTGLLTSVTAVGLFVMGCSTGKALYSNSKAKIIISEAQKLESAIESFKDKYKYMPVDFPNATKVWSNTNTHNGDGNGNLYNASLKTDDEKQYDEGIWLPQHLYLGGMLSTEFTGKWGDDTDYIPNVNTPDSLYSNDAFYSFGNYVSKKYPIFGKPAIATLRPLCNGVLYLT